MQKKIASPSKISKEKQILSPKETITSPNLKERLSLKQNSFLEKSKNHKKNILETEINMHEEKFFPETAHIKESNVPSFKEIILTKIEIEVKEIFSKNKIPLILDETDQFNVFLKYKGDKADFSSFNILEKIGKKNKEDFCEEIRKKICHSMKYGHTFALFFEKSVYDLTEFFKNVPYFILPQFLTPKELIKKEFYQKEIMKPEEDKDIFGNPGYFEVHDDFNLVLLFDKPRTELDEIIRNIKLPSELFEYIVIK